MWRVLVMTVFLGISFIGHAAIDPSELQIKVYKFAVSASVFCTNPVTIFENENPDYTDILSNPTFGSGFLNNGTYPCVIIEMSDMIKFRPASTEAPYCTANQQYTLEICRTDNGGDPFQLVNGTQDTCANGEQRLAIYLSTASSHQQNSNAFMPPTQLNDTSHGINLANAMTVSADSIARFIVDGTGQVDGTGTFSNDCEMNPPVFSFSKI